MRAPPVKITVLARELDGRLDTIENAVNDKLPTGSRIACFEREHPADGLQTGITYQCGDRRHTVYTHGRLDLSAVDELVSAVNSWAGQVAYAARWVMDAAEADRLPE